MRNQTHDTHAPRDVGRPPNTDGANGERFADLLLAHREARNLSQTQLAHLVQRSPSLISLIESGRRSPTPTLIDDLARQLHLSDIEHDRLLRAAHYTADELLTAIQHVVIILTKQTNLDETGQTLVRADLTAVATSWRTLFEGIKHQHAGRFAEAEHLFRRMAQHREHNSPTLRVALYTRLADTMLEMGKLTIAERVQRRASRIVARWPLSWAPTLRAELAATQAMLKLRRGLFAAARQFIEISKGIYEELPHTALGQDSATTMQMANQGLGKSFKRLAQVALFQDDADEALSYCGKAQDYLKLVTPSSSRARWQRRTLELQAWAHTQKDEFEKGVELHEQARAQSREAGDLFGEAKGFLYVGDDLRHQLQHGVDEAIQAVHHGPLSPEARRRLVRRAVGADAQKLIARAEDMYGEALERGKGRNQRILLGRALLGLGVILRLKATIEGDARGYNQANNYLQQALKVEREIGQPRRLPSIYVALAELAWEEGDFKWIERTRGYYRDAELAFNALPTQDSASERLNRQIARGLGLLEQFPEESSPQPDPLTTWDAAISRDAPHEWRDLCARLIATFHAEIGRLQMRPCAPSPESLAWRLELWMLDTLNGPRQLAQNELSSSLGIRTPIGTPHEISRADFQRHDTLARNVRASGERSPTIDLCHRLAVERELSLADHDKRERAREEAGEAVQLATQFPKSYELLGGAYELPLAFVMKDSRLLVEIPPTLAEHFPHNDPTDAPAAESTAASSGKPEPQTLCYRIDNAQTAEQIKMIFDRMVALARADTTEKEDTLHWLRHLAGPEQHHPKQSLAGSAI